MATIYYLIEKFLKYVTNKFDDGSSKKKLCESLLNYFKILKGSAIEYDIAKKF